MNKGVLKEYSDKLKNTKRDQVKEQINNIFNDLVVVENAKLPEDIFVEYFLDHFRYGTGDISNPLNIKWIELSGSIYNEVDIINDSGNIVYTIPPLLDRASVDEEAIKLNFSNVAATYVLKSNNLPSVGVNYLNNKIGNLDKMVEANNANMYSERWNNIFARYASNRTPVEQNDTPTVTINNNDDTFIIYD